jgi:hypothetical protein
MDFLQETSIDLGVDLGGGHGRMTQEFLDHAKVGAALEQMGGKRMSQHVRMKPTLESRRARVLSQDAPKPHAAQLAAPAVQEHDVGFAFADEDRTSIVKIGSKRSDRGAGQRDDTFPLPLSQDANVRLAKPERVQGEVQDFGHPKPRPVHEFEDGPVPKSQSFLSLGGLDEAYGFLGAQHSGKALARPGGFEFCGRIVAYFLPAQ